MDGIYQTDNDLRRHQKLKEIERQRYYANAIRKLQREVVQLKKIHSKVKYQNKLMENKQIRLRKEQDKIDLKKEKNANLATIFAEKTTVIQENQEVVNEMKNEKRTLQHMLSKRK